MSSPSEQLQNQPSSPSSRGRKNKGGRRASTSKPRRDRADTAANAKNSMPPSSIKSNAGGNPVSEATVTSGNQLGGLDDTTVCWICAEPIKYYALSECDHRTCHVCTLRLRALYKKTECTFCKNPQSSVIFTASPEASFSDFTPDRIPYKDPRLSIFFETEDMREETFVLLRYNCPDPSCDYIATGWGDLKLHTRAVHTKLLCDICIRSKRVFSHEHTLYTSAQLAIHLPSMPFRTRRQAQKDPKDVPEGGIHPLCEFCRECFFDDDELFGHMRQNHEECFLCKRNNIRDQYFRDYESLEKHFHDAHHPCVQPRCLAQKFVVFNSALDLKAHMVEQHASNMSSRDKKDARKVPAEFEFEITPLAGRDGRIRRDREREAAPQHTLFEGNRRMQHFGAALTSEGNDVSTSNDTGARRPASPPDSRDASGFEKFLFLSTRLQSLTANSPNALRAIEAAIRSYVSSESSARDLISTIWNISDRKLEDTASAVNAILDVLEDEDKKKNLLSSWNGFKIEERRQFPDLVPSGIGTGYAQITSGRVLNARNLTSSRSSQQSSRQVWDRVARAASSSPVMAPRLKPPDIFPPLQSSAPGPYAASSLRQGQRKTPWTSSSPVAPARRPSLVAVTPLSVSPDSRDVSSGASARSQPRRRASPPKFSDASFPELPSSGNVKQKPPIIGNSSLRNIVGDSTPVKSVWGTGRSANDAQNTNAVGGEWETEREPGKGKKGKGKQKQTLFTLGTFPA